MKLFLLIFLVFLPGLSISSPPWTLTTQGYGPIRPGMTPREAGQLDEPNRDKAQRLFVKAAAAEIMLSKIT
jgi:hypothetical protein